MIWQWSEGVKGADKVDKASCFVPTSRDPGVEGGDGLVEAISSRADRRRRACIHERRSVYDGRRVVGGSIVSEDQVPMMGDRLAFAALSVAPRAVVSIGVWTIRARDLQQFEIPNVS
jgi:hypothetical protein